MKGAEIMTIQECAKYLKTSISTIYRLAQKRRIPSFKVSGQWRFKKELVDSWISENSKIKVTKGET
ncbi:MAG: helix-turn-helix domain-containing protein [Candidatus Helarchaeota archaeon]|nr:helix-turn-helix domain-containing protein [Candidatus Helarchaeota archaeon]